MVTRSAVAVFGSSEPRPGSPLYDLARLTGRRLAESGFDVVTGGYGGVMEAASRGAREVGGQALGVLCKTFEDRLANEYLSDHVVADDLFDRTRELVERARGFVVLAGKAGTLAELAFLWALHRAGRLEERPVVLLGGSWSEIIGLLVRDGLLDTTDAGICLPATSPDEAVGLLVRRLEPHGSG
jgi:uncharacterized protein (TIGR00730 family)